MSALLAAELPPVDACPVCHPGDNPACVPLATLDLPDGTVGAFWCGVCGTAWAARFDEHGWVVERSVSARDTRSAA